MLTIDKISELEFDELLAIQLIEGDSDLSEIFAETIPLSFNVIKTLSSENKLSEETKSFIRGLFDSVILTRVNYVERYQALARGCGKNVIKVSQIKDEVLVQKEIAPSKKLEQEKLPRRYGRVKILEDINRQNGRVTPVQRAALATNRLKNIYTNLNTRLIKDMLLEDRILSDEDYRTICSTITLVENKLEEILKKK